MRPLFPSAANLPSPPQVVHHGDSAALCRVSAPRCIALVVIFAGRHLPQWPTTARIGGVAQGGREGASLWPWQTTVEGAERSNKMLEARLSKLSADTAASLLRASLYRHLRPLKCSPAMSRLLLTSPCGTGTAVHLDEARAPLLPPPMDSSYSYRQAKSQFTDMC